MTKVTFLSRNSKLVGFTAVGHSGYASSGSDIVCAAVSAVTQRSAILAEVVLHMEGAVSADENTAAITVICTQGGEVWEKSLCADKIFLSELAKEYPTHLKIIETEV